MEMVLGVDAGGTGSRAVLTTGDGVVVGRGAAGPGNPSLVGVHAADAIGSAARMAIGGHRVTAAVVGLAGISAMDNPAIRAAFDREWTAIGLRCPVRIVGDAVTAFAAGAGPGENGGAERRGSVLIAGTGAVAALVDGLEVVRTADGLGWLLGDEGSGVWLGLEAVRMAARRPSELGAAVLAHAGARTSDELVAWAGRQPPTAFAALAPVVCASTDPAAAAIVTRAVRKLIATLAEVADDGPVVLAGGLLTADTPVRRGVLAALSHRGLGGRGLGDRARTAGDPALGAARLAASVAAGSAAESEAR